MIVGKHTYGHEELKIHSFPNESKLDIGKFCSIGRGVEVYLGGNHRTDWFTTYPLHRLNPALNKPDRVVSKGDVIIGSDVWIGNNVVIMSGVEIGHGAVIGANSVISKNVEPYSIVVGNPQKEIKKRFSSVIIEHLLILKWWDRDDNYIKSIANTIMSNNTEELLKLR
jgi:acetyltransferase-like isoleucine patch superfamily enzyme